MGNVYLVGFTSSPNFPFDARSVRFGGWRLGSVRFQIGPTGVKLLFSTCLGGQDSAKGFGVGVRREVTKGPTHRPSPYMAVFATGFAHGAGFPVTAQAFQQFCAGEIDVFVTKIAT